MTDSDKKKDGGVPKGDHHFPVFVNDNPVRKLFFSPRRLVAPHVSKGQTVTDVGSGPGFYTLAMAELVGPDGKVYAVDSDAKVIRALEEKARARGLRNIEAHAASAGDMGFIPSGAVDFVFANGALCCVAPSEHAAAVSEIKRILKPAGRAFLSVAKVPMAYVGLDEWESILEGFKVHKRGEGFPLLGHRWALVSRKPDV
jgi:ubiquinone/menaquinone biosynthesis C-methylase UbiE